ncbi:MAG: SDR family oxidoreductase [Pseudomonadota bacterium]
MEHLLGKTAIITGASRGIGEATARCFAKLGAKVVLAARSKADIDAITEDLCSAGYQAIAKRCDVRDNEGVKSVVEATTEIFGGLDFLVNNAGLIDPIALLSDSEPEAWGRCLDVNVKGVYHGFRHALPVMRAQQSGTIINLSSGAATSYLEGWAHYCASKAAVQSLTGVAHKENASYGIRVIGLSPGTVATDMQVLIKASGINPVSQIDPNAHIPAAWVAQAIAVLCGPEGDEFCGTDFSLKTNAGRQKVGLPLL